MSWSERWQAGGKDRERPLPAYRAGIKRNEVEHGQFLNTADH